ncbi:MAG: nucleotidyltransferase [Candidatus Eremiobacteraeota bacterium]|nr:nucleotidyltransferase [Candidatus Eremiobacteraeota bacterium]
MSISSSAFVSNDADTETLFKRIRPSVDQEVFLQEKWQRIRDHLQSVFRVKNPSTWLQGSYKYGTLVRPIHSGDEFDVDMGFYISPTPTLQHTVSQASAYKGAVRTALSAYAESDADSKNIATAKERCERVHFQKQFHVDVPCYDYVPSGDRRTLATQTGGWEDSDPKALYLWFRGLGTEEYRRPLRRAVCYLKVAIGLAYEYSTGARPSSIMLTVLAAECYASLRANECTLEEDDRFALVIDKVVERVTMSAVVANPVDRAEDLNRLNAAENATFREHLTALQRKCRAALSTDHPFYSAILWGEVFGHFFPIPENPELRLKEGLAKIATIAPEIGIEVRSTRTGNHINAFHNAVPQVDKGCTLLFTISNAASIPSDGTVEWTVRNEGQEASDANDLGHKRIVVGVMHASETTKYAGRHFMDCVVKRNGRIYAARRVPVTVTNRTTTR